MSSKLNKCFTVHLLRYQYFTSVLKHLFSNNFDIIIDSFRYTVNNKRAIIYAFVIMSNHFHVVWQILHPYELQHVRQNLLKFTAQQFKFKLIDLGNSKLQDTNVIENSNLLKIFRADKADRLYQFWKRNPLSIEILSEKVLFQKINYIHKNPVKGENDELSREYSSASYFETGIKNWDFLA